MKNVLEQFEELRNALEANRRSASYLDAIYDRPIKPEKQGKIFRTLVRVLAAIIAMMILNIRLINIILLSFGIIGQILVTIILIVIIWKAFNFYTFLVEIINQSMIKKRINKQESKNEGEIAIHKKIYDETKRQILNTKFLSKRYFKMSVIDTMMNYLRDNRASSVKDVVNLYEEEEIKRKHTELLEESLHAARSATISASMAESRVRRANEKMEVINQKIRDINQKIRRY